MAVRARIRQGKADEAVYKQSPTIRKRGPPRTPPGQAWAQQGLDGKWLRVATRRGEALPAEAFRMLA
jgi:hypothetical protein